ncbi:hypothetical protein LA52FAK_13960 [Desulforhopalus sp. 52FAK]
MEEADIADFLYPKLQNLPQPDQMKGLMEAASRIKYYIENDLQIVVWGDYDVDGTTSTGLLVNFFRELGVAAKYHIPNRLTEGYGLNVEWLQENISDFFSRKFLLITVDCGISNVDEIESIKTLGGEVVVTDHHSIPPGGIPRCIVVNPSQKECGFNSEKLAGVGVAFYLAAAVRKSLTDSSKWSKRASGLRLKNYMAFVALGTVADLVEITQTNRILVRAGLEALKTTEFPGLKALLSSCGLYDQEISSEDIGFLIGPKINAAGRLGRSDIAIDLFLAGDESKAREGAEQLERLNQKRKNICEDDLYQALESCSKSLIQESFCCICSGEYHLGVAGIVASRLVEEFKVPSIVFAQGRDDKGVKVLKGSVRSVEGINVIEALNNCKEHIEKYGGHEMAAGLTIQHDFLDLFSQNFSKYVKKQLEGLNKKRKITKATEASVDEVMDSTTLSFLTHFEPYGPGNESPIFLDRNTKVVQAKTVGKLNSHLNLIIRGEYSNYKGIGFNLGDRVSIVQENPESTIYFAPTKNRYRGTVSWQLRVVDLI